MDMAEVKAAAPFPNKIANYNDSLAEFVDFTHRSQKMNKGEKHGMRKHSVRMPAMPVRRARKVLTGGSMALNARTNQRIPWQLVTALVDSWTGKCGAPKPQRASA